MRCKHFDERGVWPYGEPEDRNWYFIDRKHTASFNGQDYPFKSCYKMGHRGVWDDACMVCAKHNPGFEWWKDAKKVLVDGYSRP